MIHAICDFCGKDVGLSANLVSITPFQNFARYHRSREPFGHVDETKSFVMCHACMEKHAMPNPFHEYKGIARQALSYGKTLDGYTQEDVAEDVSRETRDDAPETETHAPGAGGVDLSELAGQLIDVVEDYVAASSDDPDEAHVAGKDYDQLKDRFLGTLVNWGLIGPAGDA